MDGFEILEKLGDGAYSVVYKVRRKEDSKIYALKKVRLQNLSEKEKENSLNEVRILASVKSTFVISYKEAFIDENEKSLCIVMEYADKGDLYQKICQFKKMGCLIDEVDVWRIFIQMTKGLKALHDLKILHRDLKSANIFLFSDGSAKIGDLNVSKVAHKGLGYTQTGTPYYASPEVWRDEPYDIKSDIWSLACVTYEMIALHPPFRAENMEALYNKVIKCQYGKISDRYSSDISEIIKLLLKVKSKDRPTCGQILKHPLVKKRIEFFQAEAGNENIDIDDMEEGVLLKTIRIPKNILCLTDKLPEANYDNPYHKKKFKKEGSIEKDNDKDKDKINNNTNIDCNKGSTFPNNCLPDINSKIKKKNDSNYTNEEEKVHRNTDLNNNYRNKKSNKKKLLTIEPTVEGRGLLKRSKLININSKINNNSKQEIITETLSTRPLISVEKERIDLKNSSSSKNKINIKTIDKLYNNEEKSNLKADEIKIENPNNANLPNHKRYQTKKNKRLKELHKYFNDLGINDTYKLYIPQIDIANSNKNKCNNNLTNNNIKNIIQKKIGNRYGHNLPNLYQPHRIRKNNSNSLKHYDDIKFDLVVKPMKNRKLNLNLIKV
jgi:NIMA (never in mitosis gene a)-related kinase